MFTPFLRAAALGAALLPARSDAAALTLNAALDLAVARSESARSARAGVTSARETSRAAGQLPDPVFRAGIDNLPVTGPDRLNTTRDSMTMKRIGISQEWVSPEKRSARLAAAEAAVRREAAQADVAIADTRMQTALFYLDANYAAEALKLTSLMEHHAHEELEASKARLASSAGGSQEVLALMGARATAADESADFQQQQASALIQLQRWVGVRVEGVEPVATMPLPSEEAYLSGNPTLVAMQRDVELARQAANLAQTNRRPNWTWEVSYGQRTGYSDMVSFGVSVPIPLAPAQRQDRETAAKLALVAKAEAEAIEATRTATAEYRGLVNDIQRLSERLDRYRIGVVQVAEQRTAAALASYRSNQTTLLVLFEARHAEVDAQRKLLTLQRDLAKTQARLVFRPIAGRT
jgi:outer membrane protein, heavy metal efflux system